MATLATRLKALYPYELPELTVVAIPVCAGSAPYRDWIRHNMASQD
ncbi:MAG: divalent cation tolerance protein CutA [Steroidobacteraceae bacterium]